MFRTALAFCAGAAAVHALPSAPPAAAAAVPAAAALGLLARAPGVAAFLAGCAAAGLAAATALAGAWPCARDREAVVLEGRVAAPAIQRPERTDFDFEIGRPAGGHPEFGRVRLSWYEAGAVPRAGERWRFGARLRCPRGFANPGAPDRELALLRDGIGATGYVIDDPAQVRVAGRPLRGVEPLRERVAAAISAALRPGPSAAVLQGLAVGLRGNIPDGLWDALAATGLAHLVAISGLHVTGCALAALVLLRCAWRIRLLPATRLRLAAEGVTVTTATAAYAVISGASVPALRTVAMVALFHALRALRRNLTVGAALALAAAILVAADPLALASAGFWLSFVATAALLAAGSAGTGWRARAIGFARAQAAVTALLAPVLAATFGRLSLVAPLVNAVAIPAFGVLVLPVVLFATALALAAPGASAAAWQFLAAILDAAWPLLEGIARWPGASFGPAAQAPALIAIAGGLTLGALVVPLRGLRVAAGVALLALACGQGARVPTGAFMLTVLDVGQGQAAVIETAGRVVVFDAGPRWRGGTVAARVSLLPYLRSRGLRTVDLLVLSHDDADHSGGADSILGAIEVRRRMGAPGGRVPADEACVAGSSWRWDGVEFRVLHPPPGFEGGDNDRSCALRVAGPGGSVLLLGDPEASAEAALARQSVASDVVLVPHHGSATSSSPALVAAVSARFGIVSSGFGNRWGMPRTEVLARWRAAGTTIVGTASHGAVRVSIPPRAGSPEFGAERHDEPRWWRAKRGG
jgi:competence protein ComEC